MISYAKHLNEFNELVGQQDPENLKLFRSGNEVETYITPMLCPGRTWHWQGLMAVLIREKQFPLVAIQYFQVEDQIGFIIHFSKIGLTDEILQRLDRFLDFSAFHHIAEDREKTFGAMNYGIQRENLLPALESAQTIFYSANPQEWGENNLKDLIEFWQEGDPVHFGDATEYFDLRYSADVRDRKEADRRRDEFWAKRGFLYSHHPGELENDGQGQEGHWSESLTWNSK